MILLLCTAFGGGASVAEARRLSTEVVNLEQRGVWRGVDKAYERAVETGESLDVSIHKAGARAALQDGDADRARERLLRAYEVERDPEVLGWLTTFSRDYARLMVRVDPGAVLDIERLPFDPDRARVVVRAQKQVAEDLRFDGLLPAGRYRIGSFWFKIQPDGADVIADLRACSNDPLGCPVHPEATPISQQYAP